MTLHTTCSHFFELRWALFNSNFVYWSILDILVTVIIDRSILLLDTHIFEETSILTIVFSTGAQKGSSCALRNNFRDVGNLGLYFNSATH